MTYIFDVISKNPLFFEKFFSDFCPKLKNGFVHNFRLVDRILTTTDGNFSTDHTNGGTKPMVKDCQKGESLGFSTHNFENTAVDTVHKSVYKSFYTYLSYGKTNK